MRYCAPHSYWHINQINLKKHGEMLNIVANLYFKENGSIYQ